jgi:hypothetical protein
MKFDLSEGDLANLIKADAKLAEDLSALRNVGDALRALVEDASAQHEVVRSILTQSITAGDPVVVDPEPEPIDAWEGDPFEADGPYAWLPDSYDISDAPSWLQSMVGDGQALSVNDPALVNVGWDSPFGRNHYSSTEFFILPAHMSHQRRRCVSDVSSWGEAGPKWYARDFEVTGYLDDVLVWRAGDFRAGREGHVLYYNVRHNLHLKRIVGVQHGAQLVQLVWRVSGSGETGNWNNPAAWPENAQPPASIVIEKCASIDGGVINEGNAVRASWPFSIFNPGHGSVSLHDIFVRCNHPKPFHHSTRGDCHSHGFLLCSAGQRPMRTGTLLLDGIDVECTLPDREMIRVMSVDEVLIGAGRMREHLSSNGITIVNDVKRLRIEPDFDWSGPIHVRSSAAPYGQPITTLQHEAGTLLDIAPTDWT